MDRWANRVVGVLLLFVVSQALLMLITNHISLSFAISGILSLLLAKQLLGQSFSYRFSFSPSNWLMGVSFMILLAGVWEQMGYWLNIEQTGLIMNWDLILSVVVIAPVVEECLFRGYILHSLKQKDPTVAAVVSGVLFGFAHMNLFQSSLHLWSGIILGLLMLRVSSIWTSIAIHATYNLLVLYTISPRLWFLPVLLFGLVILTKHKPWFKTLDWRKCYEVFSQPTLLIYCIAVCLICVAPFFLEHHIPWWIPLAPFFSFLPI